MKYVMSLRITRKDYCSSKIFRYGLLNVEVGAVKPV